MSRPAAGSNVIDLSSAGVPQRVRFPQSSSASLPSSGSAVSSRDRYRGTQSPPTNLTQSLRTRSGTASSRPTTVTPDGYRARTISRDDILERYRPTARDVARQRLRDTSDLPAASGPSSGRHNGLTNAERAANVRDSIATRDQGRADKARAALTERDAQRAQKARAAFAAKNAERISTARSNYQKSVAANAVRAGSGAYGNGDNSSYCYQGGNYSNCYWGNGGWGNSCCWWGGWLWGWSSYCWGSWWNYYWYSGGYWSPGCCPSYYWYGPFYPSYTSVIYQTVESDPQADVVYVYEEPQEEVYVEGPIAEGEVVVAEDWAGGTPVPAADGNLNRAADHYLTLGDQAFQESRFGDAVHFYAKAVEFSPQDGILYLILADSLFATGDYHYAAYALRRAFELDPKLAMSVVDKHGFYADPIEFDRQIATLELYIQDHFLDDDARLVLAANYLFGGRPAEAVDLLENAFSREISTEPAGAALLEAAKRIQYGASTRGN
ncbi:MAG: tetratricopeptide repeat protein [Planctomycetota bacterium]|nr:tetratricopeptide repeat protein [Planctomycetota bacterium]